MIRERLNPESLDMLAPRLMTGAAVAGAARGDFGT